MAGLGDPGGSGRDRRLKLRVPNWLTFHLVIGGLTFATWTGGASACCGRRAGRRWDWPCCPLYAIGGMGAGDVKLLAGVGAWMGPALTFGAFVTSAVVGGLMARPWSPGWANTSGIGPCSRRSGTNRHDSRPRPALGEGGGPQAEHDAPALRHPRSRSARSPTSLVDLFIDRERRVPHPPRRRRRSEGDERQVTDGAGPRGGLRAGGDVWHQAVAATRATPRSRCETCSWRRAT